MNNGNRNNHGGFEMNGLIGNRGGFETNGNVTIPAEMFFRLVGDRQAAERKNRKLAKENRRLRRQRPQCAVDAWTGGFDMTPSFPESRIPVTAGIVDTVPDRRGTYVPAVCDNFGGGSPSLFGNGGNGAGKVLGGLLAGGIIGALAVGFIMSNK